MQLDLTQGPITKNLLRFALPLMLGNLLQQLYNIVDTCIVGRFLGSDALAAVGSSYTLMVFLTSILLGLCMGSGAAFSMKFGQRDEEGLKNCIWLSFLLIGGVTVLLNALVFLYLDEMLVLLQVPAEVYGQMKDYLAVIFWGIGATFLYNYYANLLRAVGNSTVPLLFLGASTLLNIGLDLLFVVGFHWGVQGAAAATVLAQMVSGVGLMAYTLWKVPSLRIGRRHMHWNPFHFRQLLSLSVLTCIQQSVMNLGILMVQGLVNSFGRDVMAAFAAAVKIDSFAYMPVQDFGNAFSTFIAQNYGARRSDRIRRGIRSAVVSASLFCFVVSAAVFLFAPWLMQIFIETSQPQIIAIGVHYLRIEGSFYVGIGILFLLYGLYRAVNQPMMSVVLTVISLGTRVLLAYLLSAIPAVGVTGIWMSVPIGWFLADAAGALYYHFRQRDRLQVQQG